MTLRARISALRELSGLTQSDFSQACGFARAYIGLIESGARLDLGASKLIALMLTVRCSLEYLVLGRGVPPTAGQVHAAVQEAQRDPRAHTTAIAREVDRVLGGRRSGVRSKRRHARAKPFRAPHPEAR